MAGLLDMGSLFNMRSVRGNVRLLPTGVFAVIVVLIRLERAELPIFQQRALGEKGKRVTDEVRSTRYV